MARVELRSGTVKLSLYETDGSVSSFDATDVFTVLVEAGEQNGKVELDEHGVTIGTWETSDLVVAIDGRELTEEDAVAYASSGLIHALRRTLVEHRTDRTS